MFSFNFLLYKETNYQINLIIIILITFLLSWLSYKYVEQPLRKIKTKFIELKLLISSIIISIISILIYFGIFSTKNGSDLFNKISVATRDWDFPNKKSKKELYNRTYVYTIGEYKDKILFVGDSNMQQYAPRIDYLYKNNNYINKSSVFFTHGGCPILKNALLLIDQSKKTICARFINNFMEYVKDKNIKKVVIALSWPGYFSDDKFFSSNESINNKYNKEINSIHLESALNNLIKYLLTLKKEVFLIGNMPGGDEFDPLYKIHRSILSGITFEDIFYKESFDNIQISKMVEFNKKYTRILKILKSVSYENKIQFIDPYQYLCDEIFCKRKLHGNFIYKDGGHLTSSFVKENVTYIDKIIIEAKQYNL